MLVRALYALAVLGGLVIGATLWAWGQPLICTCGYVKLWEGFIWSSGNSQHIADWYSLSHVIHGMLIILLGRIAILRLSYPVLLIIAITTGIAWEIVEHTDWVLNRFRDVTVYQGYIGDSVLNAVMDYVWMWAGFFLARGMATFWVVILVAALEIVAALIGRDCLTFTTIQVLFPLEAIDAYQQEINPQRVVK
ncbi:MAG: DUF2585 family protein [Arenibacterium sp.]